MARDSGQRRMREYIDFDERRDVLASLELLALLALKLHKNPRHWKWVIIAAQSAVQGALVCTLAGTHGIGAYTKDLQKEWIAWYDSREGPPPEQWLERFDTLLKWACNAKRMAIAGSGALKLSAGQKRDLRRLHREFRNQFIHFAPQGWSIELAGLPGIILTAIDTTVELMLGQPHIRNHLTGNQIRRIESCVTEVRTALG
jgi:hypothetical protein